MKKNFLYISGIAITMLLVFMAVLYANNNIGVRRNNILYDARTSQKINTSWEATQAVSNSVAAVLFYNEDLSAYTYSYYINRKGLSFGYFFRSGGSYPAISNGVARFRLEEYDQVLVSMN